MGFRASTGPRPSPRIGSAVHYLVTAVSVKKALLGDDNCRRSCPVPEQDRGGLAVMLPAHTSPKCGAREAHALRRRHRKGIVNRFVLKRLYCRSPARFELSNVVWFVRIRWFWFEASTGPPNPRGQREHESIHPGFVGCLRRNTVSELWRAQRRPAARYDRAALHRHARCGRRDCPAVHGG